MVEDLPDRGDDVVGLRRLDDESDRPRRERRLDRLRLAVPGQHDDVEAGRELACSPDAFEARPRRIVEVEIHQEELRSKRRDGVERCRDAGRLRNDVERQRLEHLVDRVDPQRMLVEDHRGTALDSHRGARPSVVKRPFRRRQ